jgi:hypothetical protein
MQKPEKASYTPLALLIVGVIVNLSIHLLIDRAIESLYLNLGVIIIIFTLSIVILRRFYNWEYLKRIYGYTLLLSTIISAYLSMQNLSSLVLGVILIILLHSIFLVKFVSINRVINKYNESLYISELISDPIVGECE